MEKQKILVVDDDKHIAELISLYMMKEGYETREIYDGKEAAAAVEDFQPDLILLDLMAGAESPRNGRLSGLHRGA